MKNISIIIPSHNSAKYINNCIYHICRQTFKGAIELVFIDDCSTDNTISEIQRLLKLYEFKYDYKILRHAENMGVAAARVTGIYNATGEYVLFCDSDDWMDDRMCEIMYTEAKNFTADLVVCDYNDVYDDLSRVNVNNYAKDFLQSLLLCKCTGSLWNKLIKRNILLREDFIFPKASYIEDYVYSIQLAIMATRVRYVAIPLYNYFHREGSIVRSRDENSIRRRIQENIENHQLVEKILKEHKLFEKYYSESLALKMIVKNSIRSYFPSKEYYQLWRKTYPEMTRDLFKSEHINLRTKIAYFMTMFGLYGLVKKYLR